MGLLDDLNAPTGKVWSCKVRTYATELAPEDSKTFLDAINNPAWKAVPLATELRKRGIEISNTTINNHRNGTCSCSKI